MHHLDVELDLDLPATERRTTVNHDANRWGGVEAVLRVVDRDVALDKVIEFEQAQRLSGAFGVRQDFRVHVVGGFQLGRRVPTIRPATRRNARRKP